MKPQDKFDCGAWDDDCDAWDGIATASYIHLSLGVLKMSSFCCLKGGNNKAHSTRYEKMTKLCLEVNYNLPFKRQNAF